MFLVTSHSSQSTILINLLKHEGITSLNFPIIDLNIVSYNKDNVLNTIQDHKILCVSPTAAKLSQDIILSLNGNNIVTPGIGTYNVLSEYGNSSLNIQYPSCGSGVQAMFNNNLLDGINTLVILGGDIINQVLLKYAQDNNILIKQIILYNYNLMYKDNHQLLMRILENQNHITGIIVSSSKVADGINNLMEYDFFKNKFENLTIIAGHTQIANKLRQHKFNIVELNSPDNNSIVERVKRVVNYGK